MNQSPLSRLPALRLLLPFVLGIVLGTMLPGLWLVVSLFVAGGVSYIVIALGGHNPMRQYAMRAWWALPVVLLSMAAGALSLELYRPRPLDLQQVNGRTVSVLVENVEAYDYGMRLQVRLMDCGGNGLPPQRVLLTTRGCDYLMREGDVLAFDCNLAPVTNSGNPDEFDRESHLWQQGILYSQNLPVNKLCRLGHRPTLLACASSLRRQLMMRLLNTSLSPPALDMMIALLLGNSRLIDPGVRMSFSQAGVAHILALSGLHVGLISSLIWLLLFPLDYLRLKKLRLLLTMAALVAFAVFTGLSPSVVRATIMIGFTMVAIVLYRKSVALNAMSVSALVTLCIWPTAIYQAGFQLSYVTVAAIVGWQSVAMPSVNRRRRVLRWLWSLVGTSLIAMAATIMLSAYYFCSISMYSVLTNVLILPLMPVVMVLGVVFLFLAVIRLEWNVLNNAIELVYNYMSQVSQAVASLPGSHFSGVYVTELTVILFYVALGCVVIWGVTRNFGWLMGAMGFIAIVVGHLAWLSSDTPTRGLMVLNDYGSTPIVWHENGHVYTWIPDNPTADRQLFEQVHRRLVAHMGADSLHWVKDSVKTTMSMVRSPLAYIHGKRLLVAGKGMSRRWLEWCRSMEAVDVLVVTKRYHGSLRALAEACRPELVLLSGDLPDERCEAHADTCRRLNLAFHDIKHTGAYVAR